MTTRRKILNLLKMVRHTAQYDKPLVAPVFQHHAYTVAAHIRPLHSHALLNRLLHTELIGKPRKDTVVLAHAVSRSYLIILRLISPLYPLAEIVEIIVYEIIGYEVESLQHVVVLKFLQRGNPELRRKLQPLLGTRKVRNGQLAIQLPCRARVHR